MTNTKTKASLKVVFGTLNLGKEGAHVTFVHDLKDCAALLDTFQSHGYDEVDTARLYGFGSTEEYLAQLKWQDKGLRVGTKLSPKKIGPNPYSHKPDDLKRGVQASLTALNADKIDLFYLHMPDHETPYEETLSGVNELYNAGYFSRFGICNFAAWEVAQICELCDRHGWKKPDVYQVNYNALRRSCEDELFPCLRRYGIACYAFSPLAGGMLSDRYQRDETTSGDEHDGAENAAGSEDKGSEGQHQQQQARPEQGSRFDPHAKGGHYRKQYWNETSFAALDVIRPVAKRHGMTTSEAALRWVAHHSSLRGECGDAVIIGASRPAQLEENFGCLERGPLPEELVLAFAEAWGIVRATAVPYFM